MTQLQKIHISQIDKHTHINLLCDEIRMRVCHRSLLMNSLHVKMASTPNNCIDYNNVFFLFFRFGSKPQSLTAVNRSNQIKFSHQPIY